jgi:microcystin-dependent protein
MPQTTSKLGLKQPLGNESVSREAYNENLRLMDQNAASQAEVDEPFFLKTVIYHTASHRIDLTLGPGRASFLGVMVAKIGDSTLFIDSPAPNTAYYIFITKEGNFVYNSTNINLAGAVPIWSVNTGDSISDITTQDLRGKLPGAAARIVQDNLIAHTAKVILDHPDNSVSDAKIGNRNISDTVAPVSNGSLTTLLGGLAYMEKTITGKSDWQTAPALNLEDVRVKLIEAVPPGAIMYFARSNPPPGWLKANGALVSRTAYSNLFAAIGTTFGAGDGSTTFQLPELRGEFIRGWDNGRGVDLDRGFGSWQPDELKSHTHGIPEVGPSSEIDGKGLDSGNDNVTPTLNRTEATGGMETRPRNITMLACIKY